MMAFKHSFWIVLFCVGFTASAQEERIFQPYIGTLQLYQYGNQQGLPLALINPQPPCQPAGREAVRKDGTQKNVIDTMQTRMELYDHLGYHAYEQKLDALFKQ